MVATSTASTNSAKRFSSPAAKFFTRQGRPISTAEKRFLRDSLLPLLTEKFAKNAHVTAVIEADRAGIRILLDGLLHDRVGTLVKPYVNRLRTLLPKQL